MSYPDCFECTKTALCDHHAKIAAYKPKRKRRRVKIQPVDIRKDAYIEQGD